MTNESNLVLLAYVKAREPESAFIFANKFLPNNRTAVGTMLEVTPFRKMTGPFWHGIWTRVQIALIAAARLIAKLCSTLLHKELPLLGGNAQEAGHAQDRQYQGDADHGRSTYAE